MPEIVAKIIYEDGTEKSYGPVEVTELMATSLDEALAEAEAERLQAVEEARVADAEVRAEDEVELRNQQAIDHQLEREAAAERDEEVN